jgi:iron only hydrogenase large subunit-like protein
MIMDHNFPIYTELVECQDCYKCVRVCPSKAIRVQDGHASIIPELCNACGHCVVVCPAKAKKVRDDLSRCRHLLESSSKVYVSLAPSWVTEFPDVSTSQIVAAIKELGFAGVSETALGAEEVSAGVAQLLDESGPGLFISSACPSAVEYISKQMEGYKHSICNVLSPLLAHTLLLRKALGNDIKTVFFGPCIAKKIEADRNPDKLTLALTFFDLKKLLDEKNIIPGNMTGNNEQFVIGKAKEGSLYPIDGGMIATLEGQYTSGNVEAISVSGTENINRLLAGFNEKENYSKVFVEALVCPGGCIGGPCRTNAGPGIADMLKVRSTFSKTKTELKKAIPSVFEKMPVPAFIKAKTPSPDIIKKALAKVGKYTPEDELNCGGCGYDTCRLFAEAMLNGKAETSMCVSLMRKKALNKANAILRCMPSAVVIADKHLKIIECNKRFAEIFGEDTIKLYEVLPSLQGAYLDKILTFPELFKTAIRTGEDILRRNLKVGDKLLHVTIFTIEPSEVVGAIIQDATEIELKREEIASKANDVLRKNLNTVQGIAKLLGEHMADTEILLRSIAKGFKSGEGAVEITDREDN